MPGCVRHIAARWKQPSVSYHHLLSLHGPEPGPHQLLEYRYQGRYQFLQRPTVHAVDGAAEALAHGIVLSFVIDSNRRSVWQRADADLVQ